MIIQGFRSVARSKILRRLSSVSAPLKIWAAAVIVGLPAASAFASVQLFRENQAPETLGFEFTLPEGSIKPTADRARPDFNSGLAGQAALRFLNGQGVLDRLLVDSAQGEVPTPFSTETLILKRVHRSTEGFTLRFQQRKNRTPVIGAEVLVRFDANGQLLHVNSSLSTLKGLTATQPTVSRKAALQAAIRAGGYQDAEVAPSVPGEADDGLLFVRSLPGQVRSPIELVWQFHLREAHSGDRAAQVRIRAAGPQAGSLQQFLPLAHNLGTPISIYDASITAIVPNPLYKGVKVLENGKPTLAGRLLVSDEATAANRSFEKTLGFYESVFHRVGYDSKGAEVIASVNTQKIGFVDLLGQKQNAAWLAPWKMFIFGAGGDMLGGFTSAIDVVAHEFTHAVISHTSDLEYVQESGALNEHLADVFGEMIQADAGEANPPFLLGETTLRGDAKKEAAALRDMLHPEKGLSEQPGTIADMPPEFGKSCTPSNTNDNCGVHILSGIPNRAIALAAEKVGWTAIREVLYVTMTQRLRSNSNFNDYRDQTLDECKTRLRLRSAACQALKDGFSAVGL